MKLSTRRELLSNIAAVFSAAMIIPSLAKKAYASGSVATNHEVAIRKFKFEPDHLAVKPGDVIVWTNFDIAPHTASANDESWDSRTIEKDQSYSMLVTENMSAEYFCKFHPHMKASLHIT